MLLYIAVDIYTKITRKEASLKNNDVYKFVTAFLKSTKK